MKPDVQMDVSRAIYDQYKPESMEDDVPRTLEGAVLAIADKADTIAGMFALGMVPTGSKDPFALRRPANGIVKTLIEHNLPLGLSLGHAGCPRPYHGTDAETKFSNAARRFCSELFPRTPGVLPEGCPRLCLRCRQRRAGRRRRSPRDAAARAEAVARCAARTISTSSPSPSSA